MMVKGGGSGGLSHQSLGLQLYPVQKPTRLSGSAFMSYGIKVSYSLQCVRIVPRGYQAQALQFSPAQSRKSGSLLLYCPRLNIRLLQALGIATIILGNLP